MPTTTIPRSTFARRRFRPQAPSEYMAMNMAMFENSTSGTNWYAPTMKVAPVSSVTASGCRRRRASGAVMSRIHAAMTHSGGRVGYMPIA